MKKIIYRAGSRGGFKNSWLNTRYSFSFADYYDRNRMHFGTLRVLNDDIIQPKTGFGKHPHDNMEIITIPLRGRLSHQDSMEHKQDINENDVQVMSAGTGIFHSEYNESDDEVKLFQIWIYPSELHIKPSYDQKEFNPELAKNNWQTLVSGFKSIDGSLVINQYAKISRVFLEPNSIINYKLDANSFGSYIMLVEGEISIENENLKKRDAIGLSDIEGFSIKSKSNSHIINIEVNEKF